MLRRTSLLIMAVAPGRLFGYGSPAAAWGWNGTSSPSLPAYPGRCRIAAAFVAGTCPPGSPCAPDRVRGTGRWTRLSAWRNGRLPPVSRRPRACDPRRGKEKSHGRRTCRSQRQPVVPARRVEHRDLHLPAVLPVPEVRERRGRRLSVPGRAGRDGRGDVLVRLLVVLLLRRFAGRSDRRHRARAVFAQRRPLLAARMRA